MARYNKTPSIIPVILIIVGIVIAVVALFSIAKVMFFPTSNTTTTTDVSRDALLSLAADRKVVMTVRGEIVSEEKFRTYQITITPTERDLTVLKGYQNQVLSNEKLVNSTPSYEQFVYALDRANFVAGTEPTGDSNDTRGICATGSLYEFELKQGDASVKKLWTTSCASAKGSLDAKLLTITRLFTAQIPDAKSIIGDL